MKNRLESSLQTALGVLENRGELDLHLAPGPMVERARDAQHGDYVTNVALLLAKAAKCHPRELAAKIVSALPNDPAIAKVEVAGPGFINFFLNPALQCRVIQKIHEEGHRFGENTRGIGRKVHIEFVSANPTGPLHVGHGRGAAYGAVVANLLKATGFEVHREYYVNDAGRQMDILALSIWLRYLEDCGEALPFPSNAYRGDYVRTIAQDLHKEVGDAFRYPADRVQIDLPTDESQGGDRELHIDALVARAKSLLGEERYVELFNAGLQRILHDIRQDLGEFGVYYDEWFSERRLTATQAVDATLQKLREAGHLYEKDGAIWFASRQLGDEKDRVVIRENGQFTYFASDIAYHMNKFERGFDQVINVWGADHHGYVPRVCAAVRALGIDPARLRVLLVQFAVLYRGAERMQMSTRSGEFVTLRQLRNEVGKDAARFFYVMRKSDQHMDFDLKLAAAQSNENPVYYVQYAHARVCSVFRQLDERGWERDIVSGMNNLELLTQPHEQALISSLSRYPEIIEQAALQHEPHHLVHFLRGLAYEFHTYYNTHQFLVEDQPLRDARLNLIAAVRQVIANGLALLGVSAPETM